ncbi:MAG: DEAD/DEAH box helicase [Acidimicrobiales bacterium]|nr:DEAD/DEAH box helicase [Acidimicrobiales bacterium]
MAPAPFTLDRFQREAIAAIDAGRNVLVAAPTGAGKTVVAEHAVARALAGGRRAFYTTPIKALSNQKFSDLVELHGADQVGLLTGDNAIRPDAPVVVMTTEVLRNMIYASSPALETLDWVILDEVHYLQDQYRGPVWEEVIVHAPARIKFVCLSATVSNAEELSAWIEAARGRTETVVETERPVELVNHYLVFDRVAGELVQVETLVGGRPNPDGDRFDSPVPSGPRHLRHRGRSRQRYGTPRRSDVVEHLRGADLLPAIVFIFSRAGCDDAVNAVVNDGFRLTSSDERRRIRKVAEEHVEHLSDADLAVLGYGRWLAALEAGIAAHHAGMVPPFKEAVEDCFVQGLVKVVFATETLALGINMPARSVVIEALSKFTGESHEDLTPSQYTQLTGRAGRRGLDPVGHAIVLWSPWNGFDKVAALAASREYVLRSAFRPTPNMVVNLVRRHDRDEAHELLGRSFAQFQSDRSVGRLAHRRSRLNARLVAASGEATCERGDVEELRALRREERSAERLRRQERRAGVEEAIAGLSPGDVLRLGGHRLGVLSVAHRKGGVRLKVVDPEANVVTLDPDDFDDAPFAAGSVRLPEPYDPRNRIVQRRLASAVRKAELRHRPTGPARQPAERPLEVASSKAADHPVASCPDLERHLAAAAERDRLRGRLEDIDRRMAERTSSLRRQFDLLVDLLERRGFVDGWSLTDRGEVLAKIFHEDDLLCATVLCDGVFDGLDPARLAGLVSCLTYEHRSKEPPPPPWYPDKDMRDRVSLVMATARELNSDLLASRLPVAPEPDPTFLSLAYGWASGGSLDVVIADEQLTGGDFVRNIKTLIDLLRQIATVAPSPDTRRSASDAADALLHGVVAVSSELGPASPEAR